MHRHVPIDAGQFATMTNPFENEDYSFVVLVNDEGQHSLWPQHLDTPAGWQPRGPQGTRAECLAWIESQWTDMRPLSLVREMEREDAERPQKS